MIPFNKPFMTGRELSYIAQAHANGHLAGNGEFSKRCAAWLEQRIGSQKALLTHSCTAALEMAAILSGVGPGDEVIMPSFTFVSTANAFVLRGATPVFVDVLPDTLNIDPAQDRARDHASHAGDRPRPLRRRRLRHGGDHGDRRPARPGRHRGRRAGPPVRLSTIGRSAASATWPRCRSTRPRTSSPARAGRCSSTTRATSTAPRSSGRREPTGASSSAARSTSTPGSTSGRPTCRARSSRPSCGRRWRRRTRSRRVGWRSGTGTTQRSRTRSGRVSSAGPIVPPDRSHNAHMYYVLLRRPRAADGLHRRAQGRGIQSVFHYIPLHSSPFGRSAGRSVGDMSVTDDSSERLVRLPLWLGLEDQLPGVIAEVIAAAGAGS